MQIALYNVFIHKDSIDLGIAMAANAMHTLANQIVCPVCRAERGEQCRVLVLDELRVVPHNPRVGLSALRSQALAEARVA